MKKVFSILFLIISCTSLIHAQTKSIRAFGAKGDGIADDTQAFINGVQGSSTLTIPAGVYNIKGVVNFTGLYNKTIIADKNAVIRNTTDDQGTFNILKCGNITISGGTWTYLHLPQSNGKTGMEHYFLLSQCKNIVVTHIHLIGSAETGFNIVSGIGITISNNIIEQCYRDGIYSHYSSNLIYCGNYIHDIKDDAMSLHDYGILSQRFVLTAAGIAQAGNAIIFNNVTRNTYQGFASVGCTNLFIANNDMQNTVTGGIAITNSETLFVGSTARANHITINNNTLAYIGGNPKIMNDHHQNVAQLGTGHAAIFVGSTDEKNHILDPKTRLQYVTVNNNRVSKSYENGAYLAQIDHLNFFNNTFTGNNMSEDDNTGKTVEILDCNNAAIGGNVIKDMRLAPSAKDMAYELSRVNGVVGGWSISSRAAKKNYAVDNSALQNVVEKQRDVNVMLAGFSLGASEFKVIRQPFAAGLLADHISLTAPAGLGGKVVCNAFLDGGVLVVIVRNVGKVPLRVGKSGWGVREFYHD
jgi:hypothetical protein